MPRSGEIVYRLDDRDEFCFVNGEYDSFARDNCGEAVASHAILRRPLWDFVTDPTTQQLYRDMLRRVRAGRPVRFRFRCDSPARRRLLEMDVRAGDGGGVEFRVRTVSEEDRPYQPLFDPHAGRSDERLRVCGWCKKVHVGDAWAEVEDAVARLHLFERAAMPEVTHGICEECFRAMTDTLAESDEGPPAGKAGAGEESRMTTVRPERVERPSSMGWSAT
jgi:hypothetical protein